jgi:hypothetical protein
VRVAPFIVLLLAAAPVLAVQTNFAVRVPRTYDARVHFHQVAVLQREEQKEESHVYVHPQGSGMRGLDDAFARPDQKLAVARATAKPAEKRKDFEQEKKDKDLQKAKPGMESWNGLARDVLDRTVERDARKVAARREELRNDDGRDRQDDQADAADDERAMDAADDKAMHAATLRAGPSLRPAESLDVRDEAALIASGSLEPLMPVNQLSPLMSDEGLSADALRVPAGGGLQPAAAMNGMPSGLPDLQGLAPAVQPSAWSIGDAGGGSLFGGGSAFGQATPMLPDSSRSVFQQEGPGMQQVVRPVSRPGQEDGRKSSTLPW